MPKYILLFFSSLICFSSCLKVETENSEIDEYPFGIAQYLPAKKVEEFTYLSGVNEWPMNFKMYYLGDTFSQIGDQAPLHSKTIQAKYADINNDGFRISSSIHASVSDTMEVIMIQSNESYCLSQNKPNTLSYSRKKKKVMNSQISMELYDSLALANWSPEQLYFSNHQQFIIAQGGIVAFKKCEEWYVLKVHQDS